MELDYQLGEDIKEKLIPRAVDWYTGEALQFEELDDMEGEFDDEDEDDEDISDEDRDEDDEESEDEVSFSIWQGSRSIKTDNSLRMTMASQNNKKLPSASKADRLL